FVLPHLPAKHVREAEPEFAAHVREVITRSGVNKADVAPQWNRREIDAIGDRGIGPPAKMGLGQSNELPKLGMSLRGECQSERTPSPTPSRRPPFAGDLGRGRPGGLPKRGQLRQQFGRRHTRQCEKPVQPTGKAWLSRSAVREFDWGLFEVDFESVAADVGGGYAASPRAVSPVHQHELGSSVPHNDLSVELSANLN